MIHSLPLALLLLPAGVLPARAEEPPPGWFVLRLKNDEALELFRDFARKRENLPAGCSYGGKSRVRDSERVPEGTVAEIEYRLLCYVTTPITAAPEIPRTPAVVKEKEIRSGTQPRPRTVREKFLFVWTGNAWSLKGRAEEGRKPPPANPPPADPGNA